MLGMWDVRDVRCSGCSGVGCSGFGMFGMWDVWDAGVTIQRFVHLNEFGLLILSFCTLSYSAHLCNCRIFPLLVLETSGFLLSVFFLHFQQFDNILL